MAHEFAQGFFVREPAWHELGSVIPDYLPLSTDAEIDAAMALAGHNFEVATAPVTVAGKTTTHWQGIVKVMPGDPTDGQVLHVARESYVPVSNRACWALMQEIVGEGLRLETAVTLRGGEVCSLLAWLNEPVRVAGDDSDILPFFNLSWAHDGSGAVRGRPTSVRVVCMNTLKAAELQGQRTGNEFEFSVRHTKNAQARIDDVKLALRGLRHAHAEFVALANDLASQPVTAKQRDYFIRQFIPMPDSSVEISDRVLEHIDMARAKVNGLFTGPTIPEAHRTTAYGLLLAGTEYLDHLRPYRSKETYYGRSLLRNEPAKAKLTTLIKESLTA